MVRTLTVGAVLGPASDESALCVESMPNAAKGIAAPQARLDEGDVKQFGKAAVQDVAFAASA